MFFVFFFYQRIVDYIRLKLFIYLGFVKLISFVFLFTDLQHIKELKFLKIEKNLVIASIVARFC